MRLIDADELLLNNTWLWFDENGNHTIAGDAIEDAPTVDAIEVVRCKDCKFGQIGLCGAFNENDFCSQGEKENL